MSRKSLIAVILLAVAVLLVEGLRKFIRARNTPASVACLNNLRTIEGAKAVWTLENHKTTNDVPTDSDIFGPDRNIKEKPSCPAGGTYTLGPVGQPPRCSVPGHKIETGR